MYVSAVNVLHSICQPQQIGMKIEKLKNKFIF